MFFRTLHVRVLEVAWLLFAFILKAKHFSNSVVVLGFTAQRLKMIKDMQSTRNEKNLKINQ